MANSRPPVALLWEKYSYSPFTGRFYRKSDGREIKGSAVGIKNKTHQISVGTGFRIPYGVCVYAWLFAEWPQKGEEVDHLNRDPFNHSPWNIRKVSRKENAKNKKRSGPMGRISQKDIQRIKFSAIPESLRNHIHIPDALKNPIHDKTIYSDCSSERKKAIHTVGWPLPRKEIKEVFPDRQRFRVNKTKSSHFYNSLVSAIHEKPIHIGDAAILWLAIVPADYSFHGFIYFCRQLCLYSGYSILINDGYISFAREIDNL